jgi:hypothetical protein
VGVVPPLTEIVTISVSVCAGNGPATRGKRKKKERDKQHRIKLSDCILKPLLPVIDFFLIGFSFFDLV